MAWSRLARPAPNGYSNVTGLQGLVAIEVDNYHKKERLLLALDGTQICPKPTQSVSKTDSFEAVTTTHQQDQCFSFYKKGIEKSAIICFIKDPATTAIVADPREVSYDGKA